MSRLQEGQSVLPVLYGPVADGRDRGPVLAAVLLTNPFTIRAEMM